MQLYVFHNTGNLAGIVESFESCIWTIQFQGLSEFQLVTKASNQYVDLFQKGRWIARDFDCNQVLSSGVNYLNAENVMVIRSVKMNFDVEKGWILTITGKGLKSLLSQRVIGSQIATTDSWMNIFTQVFDENFLHPTNNDRQINFTIDSSSFDAFYPDPITPLPTYDVQLTPGQNIAEWVAAVCKEYNIGFDMRVNFKRPQFFLKRGSILDGSDPITIPAPFVKFSPSNNNLLTVEYTNQQGATSGLIGGEGEGANQTLEWTQDGAAGLDRLETYINASEVSSNGEIITAETYKNMLKNFGNNQLEEMLSKPSFQATINPNVTYKLTQNYHLGDKVLIDTEKGITASAYIIEIIHSVDENGETVVPTFSEWEVNE